MGDFSFTEALFLKKPIFYAIGEGTNNRVIGALYNLAKDFFQAPDSPFVKYLELFLKDIRNVYELHQMRLILKDQRFFVEMEFFYEMLQKFYTFNEISTDIVTRTLVLKNFPQVREVEEEAFQDFLNQKKTLPECHKFMESVLQLISLCSLDFKNSKT